MPRRECTEQLFLEDVAKHELTVKFNSGLYRHIRFAKPKTGVLWFEIVTWPGVLCIHGDMGTWTFARIEDMFNFFRNEPGKLSINPGYWAEKLCSAMHDCGRSAEVFDHEEFDKRLLEQLSDYYGLEGTELVAITEEVKREVLCHENEHEKKQQAYEFRYQLADGRWWHFESTELPSGNVWSYHFIWCLYAIVWGIQQVEGTTVEVSVNA